MQVLNQSLVGKSKIIIVDSTPIRVCKKYRAGRHKVAKSLADFGYNHQGVFYGFKLHISINLAGHLVRVVLTKASTHDSRVAPQLVPNDQTDILIGDTHYGGKNLRKKLLKLFRCVVIAPAHPKQKRSLTPPKWRQYFKLRSRVETVFSVLKEQYNLVQSRVRSVVGHIAHIIKTLAVYQVGSLWRL